MPSAPPLQPSSEPPSPPPPTPPLAPPPPPPPPAEPVRSAWVDAPLAPRSWRVGGLLLDVVLIACTVGIGWLAWWIIDWDSGRSPAKSVLHTRVVRAGTRELPGFGRMALREVIGKALPAGAGLIGLAMLGDSAASARFLVAGSLAWLAMSAVAALLDDQRRTLWDAFAATIVVLDPDVTPADTQAAEETPADVGSSGVSPTSEGCSEPT